MADPSLFMLSRPLFYVKDLQLNFLPALLGLRETALTVELCAVHVAPAFHNTRSRDRFRRKTIRFYDRFAMPTPLVQAYPLHGDTLTGQLHKSVQFTRVLFILLRK